MVFHCTFCGARFASNSTLRDHVMVHTGERANCKEYGCDKSYSNHANLRRHERKTHEKEREATERRLQRAVMRQEAEKDRTRKLVAENECLKDALAFLKRKGFKE
jgi:hypothetical protein